MSWQKGIILNPNEQVLHSWEGNCERHHKAVVQQRVAVVFTTSKTVESKEIHSGTLVLTNQRLLWFERRGFLSKTERASFEIDLKNLQGVTSGGVIAQWVSVTDDQGEYIFHLRGIGKKEIEPFRDMILRQVDNARATFAAPYLPPPPTQPVIQKEVITREVVMIPCQYCGGLMLQTATFCSNCGAKRKA